MFDSTGRGDDDSMRDTGGEEVGTNFRMVQWIRAAQLQ